MPKEGKMEGTVLVKIQASDNVMLSMSNEGAVSQKAMGTCRLG